jgi:hypothetical protein
MLREQSYDFFLLPEMPEIYVKSELLLIKEKIS